MAGITLNIRAHLPQRELIDSAAAALGKSRSDFMLETACRAAREVLLDRHFFALDDAAHARFTALLDAPAKPPQALRKLLAAKAPWEA